MAKESFSLARVGFVLALGIGMILLGSAPTLFAHMISTAPKSLGQGRRAYPNVIHLDQAWSDEDRLRYYFMPQGSAAMSYDIFLYLETANDQELFRADKNVSGYGLIPQPADPKYNPDGLPIGVTKTVVPDGRWKGEWVGLGCAACHNGQLEYKGSKLSISGGSNTTLDLYAFLQGLDESLSATAADPQKFARLAESLGRRDGAGKDELRRRLDYDAAAVHDYVNRTALTPNAVGPGRMDALGLIHNQVSSRWLGIPENWAVPLAPAKPSFVWNIPQSAWAQWTGVRNNPIPRNLIEVMGVFAKMDVTSTAPDLRSDLFESTVDLNGQIQGEALLRRLAPPKWPENILGKIDQERAAKGSQLFSENCAGCHSTWPHRWSEPKKQGKRFIENAIVAADVVGTDAMQFNSMQFQTTPRIKTGPMSKLLAASVHWRRNCAAVCCVRTDDARDI